MRLDELPISNAFISEPDIHSDDRGDFLEWYRFESVTAREGAPLTVKQGNLSVSRRGVVRGVHYALVPPGQAKYVTAVSGSVRDYVVDLRVGSPTFGTWCSVDLDDVTRRAVYLGAGLGHAFVAQSETATLCYLASEVYDPSREFSINPFDPDLGLKFPEGLDLTMSTRDREAPSLRLAIDRSNLPTWEECQRLAGARRRGRR